MSRKFLDFNSDTGLTTHTSFEDGKHYVRYEQDLEPYWDVNAEYRKNSSEIWAKGKKDEGRITHLAFIPDVVILDMKTRFGVNFYESGNGERVRQLIETEYPNCKVVDKKLWIPKSK